MKKKPSHPAKPEGFVPSFPIFFSAPSEEDDEIEEPHDKKRRVVFTSIDGQNVSSPELAAKMNKIEDSNLILIEQLKATDATPMFLLFNRLLSEAERKENNVKFIQFFHMDAAKQRSILVNPEHEQFCKILSRFSPHIVSALRSPAKALTNLINHFSSLTAEEVVSVRDNMNKNFLQGCDPTIKEEMLGVVKDLLWFAQVRVFDNQLAPVELYVNYLIASKSETKMNFLRELDAKCYDRQYLFGSRNSVAGKKL